MSKQITTPVTQAMSEGILTRKQVKTLMRRTDKPALQRLALWFLLLVLSSTLIAVFYDHFLIWPAMFVQGVLLVHLFALQHECVHYTVFRTHQLNNRVGQICGWLILLPNRHFRYEHTDHHTYTHQPGKDPELIPLPKTIWGYLLYLSALPYWYYRVFGMLRQSMGKLTEEEKRFIPENEYNKVFLEARLMLAGYALLLLAMPVFDFWQPLYFWLIPLALGEPMMRYIRLTEHVGRPYTNDLKLNTRTTLVNAPLRFLCWNMNYHAAHHYVPSVPFHALPQLHELLKDHVTVVEQGYWGAHREILAQLTGKQVRCDAL
ncbi:MAG: fatty acid desaturase [Thiolinea sp.]